MVGSWIRRFELLGARDIKNYIWRGGRWVSRKLEGISAQSILLRQQITGGDAEVQQEPITDEQGFMKYKGYVVWYSGKNYEVRREIAIFFWLGINERPENARRWLEQAVRASSGYSIDEVESWAGLGPGDVSYYVPVATLGSFSSTLAEGEYQKVEWRYTINNKEKRGYFFK